MSDAGEVIREYAASHGLTYEERVDTGPLTPLLVQSRGLGPVASGPLAGGPTGHVGALSYVAGGSDYRFTAALTEIPESAAVGPRIFCVRQGRRTSNTHYGFELRSSRLWTESAALNDRYKVTSSPWQDPNWMRQLFSPSFIDLLATIRPDDFSFELAYGSLLCSTEQDNPGAAGLDAICSATAEIATRIRKECLE